MSWDSIDEPPTDTVACAAPPRRNVGGRPSNAAKFLSAIGEQQQQQQQRRKRTAEEHREQFAVARKKRWNKEEDGPHPEPDQSLVSCSSLWEEFLQQQVSVAAFSSLGVRSDEWEIIAELLQGDARALDSNTTFASQMDVDRRRLSEGQCVLAAAVLGLHCIAVKKFMDCIGRLCAEGDVKANMCVRFAEYDETPLLTKVQDETGHKTSGHSKLLQSEFAWAVVLERTAGSPVVIKCPDLNMTTSRSFGARCKGKVVTSN